MNKITKSDIIHFIGIGGIGMSGIAEILTRLGYIVKGSDIAENYNITRLEELGVREITIGHFPNNIGNATIVVRSSAITDKNAELRAAIDLGLPIIERADMLATITQLVASRAVSVAGSHGKTTTTALVASLFDSAGLDPTVIDGGVINKYRSNVKLGTLGGWAVNETDESDGSFIRLPTTIGIVTNIDAEHLDFYGSFDELKRYFTIFLEQIPSEGVAILCADDEITQGLPCQLQAKRITFGSIDEELCDYFAHNVSFDKNGAKFDLKIKNQGEYKDIRLNAFGHHNVTNSLAAIAASHLVGSTEWQWRAGLANFSGVKRRFTKAGEHNGITIIDDYAHHPREIEATLKIARNLVDHADGRVIAIFQPHRHSRVANLFDDFCKVWNNVDILIVCDIYSAGGDSIVGIDKEHIIKKILEFSFSGTIVGASSEEEVYSHVAAFAKPKDLVLCMGAGTITNWAYKIADKLHG